MDRLRILIVAENLQPPWGTGTVAYAKGLLKAALSIDGQITVLATLRSRQYMARWMPKRQIEEGWEHFKQDFQNIHRTIWLEEAKKNRFVSKLSILRALRRLFSSETFDFVHLIFDGLGLPELSWAMMQGPSIQGHSFKHILTPAISPVRKEATKIISVNYRLPRNLSLAFSSNFTRDSHNVKRGGLSVVIPPTIDTEFHRPFGEPSMDRANSKLRILYLGPVIPDRFPLTILEAIEKAKRQRLAQVRLEIVTAPWRGTLEQEFIREIRNRASKLDVNESLKIRATSLTSAQKVALFNSCDAFIQPFSGIPKSVVPVDPPVGMLEAMACQKPVIASKSMSIPEIVQGERNGLLLSNLSAEEIAYAFSIIKDETQRLGQNARKLVLNRFSVPSIGTRLRTIYSNQF